MRSVRRDPMRVLPPIILCLCLLGCSRSDWDLVSQQDIPSPDGAYIATVFEMCSYNTTGYWPQISLRRPGQKIGAYGNVLSGGAGDSIEARWVSPKDLVVEYHTDSAWQSYPPNTTNINGVSITFRKL